MREDVRGLGKPLDAPKDPSADLGNFSPLFGTSQPSIQDLVVTSPVRPSACCKFSWTL